MELVVSEKRGDVAVEAVARLGVEEKEAPFFCWGKRCLTGQPAVVLTVRRNEGALKLGDGLDDASPVNGRVAKGAGEERGIFGVPLQFGHHAIPILAHFHGRLYYFKGLVFEADWRARPRKRDRLQSALKSGMEWRLVVPPTPWLKGRGSEKAWAGRWHEVQAMVLSAERMGVGEELLAKSDALDGQGIVRRDCRRGKSRRHGTVRRGLEQTKG